METRGAGSPVVELHGNRRAVVAAMGLWTTIASG